MHQDDPPHPLTRDAYIEARIAQALARNAAVVPPALVEELRKALQFALSTHPDASLWVARLRPRAALAHSDEVSVDGAQFAVPKSAEGARKP